MGSVVHHEHCTAYLLREGITPVMIGGCAKVPREYCMDGANGLVCFRREFCDASSLVVRRRRV
jgi:hypothetical protein